MGNQGNDQSRSSSNQQQAAGQSSRDKSARTDDGISQGNLDAGEIGSTENPGEEEREGSASAKPRRNP